MIIDNSCLGLANTQDERFTPFFWLSRSKGMTVDIGLGIIILLGISRRKSLAGVMYICPSTAMHPI
jgi:hypothetical protein